MKKLQKQITGLIATGLFGMLVLAACTATNSSAPAAAPTQAAATVAESATPANAPADASTDTATDGAKLNLNTVTEEQLLSTIPDFGNRMVREFFEYRPYVSIQQFRQEIGKYVDEAQVADYEQYVYVPINVNESDAATIMQIAGVDQAVADALIAARPYASNAAFLTKLTELAPTVDQAAAESYLEAQ